MFVPHSESELVASLAAGSLQESATFDGKRNVSRQSAEVAKDIAAMATDGGVIIYGIGEDANNRLTIDCAFELAGEAERISNIVNTTLSDPPTIRISRLEKQSNPGHGYLVVEVPQSPRAPHMVQIKGEYRYYGRDATGNRMLAAADVERLHRLQLDWERGVDDLIESAIQLRPDLPFMPDAQGLFHLVARPLKTDDRVLERIIGDDAPAAALTKCFGEPIGTTVGASWERSMEGARASLLKNFSQGELELSRNGKARLFWTATTYDSNGNLLLRDRQLAALVRGTLAGLGRAYTRAALICAVDLGVALQSARGATSALTSANIALNPRPLQSGDYRETTRTRASVLFDAPEEPARELLGPLFDELTQRAVDPFS
jgi:hypothetical protein